MTQFTLGTPADAASIENKPLPALAALVQAASARPKWKHDQPVETPDDGYVIAWKEMHQRHVVERGFSHMPWNDNLIARGVENFMVAGITIVPDGKSGEGITLSLDVAKKLNDKNSIDLWAEQDKRIKRRRAAIPRI
jgi:hypothetical protein